MNFPYPLPWEKRGKSVYPLPGGYTKQLNTLRTIAVRLEQKNTTVDQLSIWMCSEFGMSSRNVRDAINFLIRTDLIERRGNILVVDSQVRKMLAEKSDEGMIAKLHCRVKFIGEMLYELQESKSFGEILNAAEKYGLKWETDAQVQRRRGWLQSAKLIELRNNKLELTKTGRNFVSQIQVHVMEEVKPKSASELGYDDTKRCHTQTAESLATAIVEASTKSNAPAHFERIVTKAFSLLGFDAQHIGTTGNTDVLVTAFLGSRDSFKVCVDAKTTASGSLKDVQVDWPTLSEHRAKHEANYSLLVAPNPAGTRLFTRAEEYSVAVLSAEQLADLCRLHDKTPVGLHEYKTMFTSNGRVSLTEILEASEQIERLSMLVEVLSQKLSQWTKTFGRLSARDIELMLGAQERMHISREDIEYLLSVLSHPLVGLMYRFESTSEESPRYVLATSRAAAGSKVKLLARMMEVISP